MTEDAPILIFASGQRCGSTLLQRFLCSHPNIVIWGEHDGVLTGLFDRFARLYEWQDMFSHQYDTYIADGYNNFIPNMNPPQHHLRHAQIELVRNLWKLPAEELGCNIWGFKEVMYDAEMALLIRDLFPDVRIIHLTRNIFECFISLRHEEYIPPDMQPHVPLAQVWTRSRTLDFIATWTRVNSSMLSHPALDESWNYRITYENMVKCPNKSMEKLVNWLGLAFQDFDLGVFQHKLYTDRHKGPDQRPLVRRSDLSSEEIALLTSEEILNISEQLEFDMSVG